VIEAVPGPSAAATALAVCGLPAVPHFFAGFLPARAGERRRALEKLRDREETLVWFEAPHRLVGSLEDSADVLGARRGCVARELTKLHEEIVRGTLPELAALFRSRGAGRGEITVVVEGGSGAAQVWVGTSLEEEIRRGVSLGTPKRALARDLALKWGRPAREIYGLAVALQRRDTGKT
jgi:16S rRNA (cytidine1402-2'-O)-methyltransferase